jgi:hypothetical protein
MFIMRDLWRVALWGLTAAGALVLAVIASVTPTGRERIMLAMSPPPESKPIRPFNAEEGQQLAEAVRSLTAGHGQMLTRVARLENTVVEVAGSLARVEKTMTPKPLPSKTQSEATQVAPQPSPAAPADDATSSISQPGTLPVPRPAPATPEAKPSKTGGPSKAEFGIDLGSASSIEGLRALWATSRQRHTAQLEGLLPIVHLRERPRAAPAELRLVAGPLANAAAAARLCAAITAAGAICQPTLFDGQRLAIR